MSAYYNEVDPFAARWLRNLIANGLIAPGDVDVLMDVVTIAAAITMIVVAVVWALKLLVS